MVTSMISQSSPAFPELHMNAGVGDEQGAADQSANMGRDPAVVIVFPKVCLGLIALEGEYYAETQSNLFPLSIRASSCDAI